MNTLRQPRTHATSLRTNESSTQSVTMPKTVLDEQPGELFCCAPMNLFCVDLLMHHQTIRNLKLLCALRQMNKKGGQSVQSCAITCLCFLIGTMPGCELSIVSDDCSGQSKNNAFLHMLLMLMLNKLSITSTSYSLSKATPKTPAVGLSI